MRSITSDVESNLKIFENTYLRSVVHGDIEVASGVNLDLHGIVFGNVTVDSDSVVYIHGIVEGDVINRGGHLAIFGTVKGMVSNDSGYTFVSAQAVVCQTN